MKYVGDGVTEHSFSADESYFFDEEALTVFSEEQNAQLSGDNRIVYFSGTIEDFEQFELDLYHMQLPLQEENGTCH